MPQFPRNRPRPLTPPPWGTGSPQPPASARSRGRPSPPAKQPYRIILAEGAPIGLAGLWERWKDPASGETVRSFTIVTTAPSALCSPIHNRMPVILDPADFPAWLGETSAAPEQLQALLRPFPAERMEAHEIGPEIGNVRNDSAGLIERLRSA